MNQFYKYLSIAIFSVFIGSQITEGVLLIPYWQSLSASDFYAYYQAFGPSIGRFYTILTIIAALIPIIYTIYLFLSKSAHLLYASISALLALSFIACFYIYFKDANELFYQSALNESSLKNELLIWTKWHWGRILLEILSLVFLIFAFQKNNPQ